MEVEDEGVAEGAPLPAEMFEGLPPRMVAMVKQKIGALDGEISRFKRENERVLGLKDECEEQMRQFQEDVRDFEHKRGQEIADFNAYKEEEVKRLKREKKELEKSMKGQGAAGAGASAATPGATAIDGMKREIAALKEEMKQKERKSKTALDKLKSELSEVEHRNALLRREIKDGEKERLKAMAAAAKGNAVAAKAKTQTSREEKRYSVDNKREKKTPQRKGRAEPQRVTTSHRVEASEREDEGEELD